MGKAIQRGLQEALRLHHAGEYKSAMLIYERIVKKQKDNHGIMNLYGLAAYQCGDHQIAVDTIKRAIKIDAMVPEYHSNLGMSERALGHYESAIKCYRKAIELSPDLAGLHYNLGNVLKDMGQLEEAVSAYQRATELSAGYAEAYNNLGLALKALGRKHEALVSYQQAVRLRPNYAEGLNNLGTILKEMGKSCEAVECYKKAVQEKPDHYLAYYNLSSVLIGLSNHEEAVQAAKRALEIKPDYCEAHNNLGVAFCSMGQAEQGVAHYLKALEIEPNYPEALSNLAMAYTSQGKLEEAAAMARKAIAINPNFAEGHNNLANALKDAGRLAEAFEHYRQAVSISPEYAAAASNLLMCLNYDPSANEEGILAAHLQWDETYCRPLLPSPLRHANPPDPNRPLRVGYVSADLYRHTVSYYLLPVLAAHDRHNFQIYCYSVREINDEVTMRMRGYADHWRSVEVMSDGEAAELIRADRIDILIDLSGHTAYNRLGIFAHKPAPVQASWLGYFNTTGMSAIDYILMDPQTVPAGQEKWFREKVVRLPCGRFCYAPPEYAPPVAPPPCLVSRQVTFGSFNNLTKVSAPVVELWSELLARVKGARLVLKWKTLTDASERERLWAMFASHGIEQARVDLRPPSPHPQMLAQYGDIDIALDPFPFSGGVTSCEALWMGVPIVTWPGRRPVSRQTMGFLTALGLHELVAETSDHYLAVATALANSPQHLAQLRAGMRARMANSPLCNGPVFTRVFESHLRKLWQNWCTEMSTSRGTQKQSQTVSIADQGESSFP